MPLTVLQIEEAAKNLFNAEKNKKRIGLLSIQYENIDMEDAYKIEIRFWPKNMGLENRTYL